MRTLAFDVGGSRIKSLTVGPLAEPIGPHRSEKTPRPATPRRILDELVGLAHAEEYDRVSVGFPGLVQAPDGVVLTAPNLDGEWRGFPLASTLHDWLDRPIRVAKDADIHGLGAVSGSGVELVLTLGTGLGSALFIDGHLLPNVDLAHHPLWGDFTYEQLLGKTALERSGTEAWQLKLLRAIDQLHNTFNYDTLFLGGGHASLVTGTSLPSKVQVVSNIVGLLGSVALWDSNKSPSSWASDGGASNGIDKSTL